MKQPQPAPGQPQLLTEQSIFKRLYEDPLIIVLQVALGTAIALDYFFLNVLLKDAEYLLLVTLGISAVLFFAPRLPFGKLNRNYFVHSTFHLMTALFIIFIVPVGSPYELILLLLIYISTYWYGSKGFWLSFITVSATLVAASFYQLDVIGFAETYRMGVMIVLFLLIGGILERLHALDLRERRELVEVSREVSLEHQRLRSLINSMADAVIAIDHMGRVLVYNGATLDLLNSNEVLEGKPINDTLRLYAKKEPVDVLELARSAPAALKRDDLLLKIDKKNYLNLYLSISRVNLDYEEEKEREYGYILLLRDISKEKSLEEQRDEFVSVVSHELRTPISIIEGNLSTALMPQSLENKAKLKELLQQAYNNLIFLADIVNDVTTLSQIERGNLQHDFEEIELKPFLSELKAAHAKEAKEKDLQLKLTISGVKSVTASRHLLGEILTNFLSNAIKYTDKGSVTIGAKRKGDKTRLFVADTGIGISLSDNKYVFERFWRSEDYRTRTHGGVGLGLYITKKLAEKMGAEIGFDSELNKGSTFYLDLPDK